VRLTSINRAPFPFLLKNNLDPGPKCSARLYSSKTNANEIQNFTVEITSTGLPSIATGLPRHCFNRRNRRIG